MNEYVRKSLRYYVAKFNQGKRAGDWYKMTSARDMVEAGACMALDLDNVAVFNEWRKIYKIMDKYIFNYVMSK